MLLMRALREQWGCDAAAAYRTRCGWSLFRGWLGVSACVFEGLIWLMCFHRATRGIKYQRQAGLRECDVRVTYRYETSKQRLDS